MDTTLFILGLVRLIAIECPSLLEIDNRHLEFKGKMEEMKRKITKLYKNSLKTKP